MKAERKQMLDKLVDEIVEEMYQAEIKLSYEELRLMCMYYEKKSRSRMFHSRTVLNTYKKLLIINGLEGK